MGYTEEIMQNLSINIRNLNNNIDALKELNSELKRSNTIKELELGLKTGLYTAEDVNEIIASGYQKTKSKKVK